MRRHSVKIAAAIVGGLAASAALCGEASGDRGSATPASAERPRAAGDTAVDFSRIVRGIRPRGFGVVPYALRRPTAGSREWFVGPSGDDSADGTRALPLRTIGRAAELATSGDVVTITPGTYSGNVVVRHSGTPSAPIVFQAAERGSVILTGGAYSFRPRSWTGGATRTGQWYVTVRGLVFRRYSDPHDRTDAIAAVRAAKGWLIQDVLFDEAGRTGLEIRDSDVTVEHCTFRRHHENALVAWGKGTGSADASDPRYAPLTGLVVRDVILVENNVTRTPLTGRVAEYVAKFTGTRGAIVDNIESRDNYGNGFWFDKRNTDYTIRNSYFHGNRAVAGVASRGRGLFIEVNWPSGLVEHNVLRGNSGAGLTIANSQSVEVRNNLMDDNSHCVTFINADRGDNADGAPRYPLRDVRIHDNVCARWKVAAIATVGGSFPATPAMSTIVVDANRYAPSTSRVLAEWNRVRGVTTLGEMRRRLSWETSGTLVAGPER